MAKRFFLSSVLLMAVLLLVWHAHGGAQPVSEPQSGSQAASQATVEPQRGVAQPLLKEPPQLSPEELQRLEEALKKTHLPAPPLPVDSAISPESMRPTNPPTEKPSEGKGRPTSLQELKEREAAPLAATDFVFQRNLDLGSGAPSTSTSNIGEPSAGTKGDVVFYSGNWYTALSTNGGQTFSYINPYTGPFTPPTGQGFCCDQIVIYEPSRDAMFYLQQYVKNAATGTQRINVDMGADGTFDCFYDFTPQGLGRPAGDWFDFPELSLGANRLYHTSNIFNQVSQFAQASMISSYPLDQIAACQTVNFSFFVATDRFSFRPTHGAGTTVYWGSHNSTSSIRIYRWTEGSGTIFSDNRTITAWNNGTGVCPGPDGRDWCGRADGRILGAYVADGVIGFMWNASQGGSFPFPHIRWARFRESDRGLIDQPTLWNQGFAWQYPSVGVNASDEIAGTVLWGGGNFFPNCAAWIKDAVSSGAFQSFQVVNSTSGPTANQSGDYLASRPHSDWSNSWIATCFSLQGGGANSNARPRYVWFGRDSNLPPCGVVAFASSMPSTAGMLPIVLWMGLPILFVAAWKLSLKRQKGDRWNGLSHS